MHAHRRAVHPQLPTVSAGQLCLEDPVAVKGAGMAIYPCKEEKAPLLNVVCHDESVSFSNFQIMFLLQAYQNFT